MHLGSRQDKGSSGQPIGRGSNPDVGLVGVKCSDATGPPRTMLRGFVASLCGARCEYEGRLMIKKCDYGQSHVNLVIECPCPG